MNSVMEKYQDFSNFALNQTGLTVLIWLFSDCFCIKYMYFFSFRGKLKIDKVSISSMFFTRFFCTKDFWQLFLVIFCLWQKNRMKNLHVKR